MTGARLEVTQLRYSISFASDSSHSLLCASYLAGDHLPAPLAFYENVGKSPIFAVLTALSLSLEESVARHDSRVSVNAPGDILWISKAEVCACILISCLTILRGDGLFRRIGRSALRPGLVSAACRVERPPALFSQAEENFRPHRGGKPALASSTGEGSGWGSRNHSLIPGGGYGQA